MSFSLFFPGLSQRLYVSAARRRTPGIAHTAGQSLSCLK